MEIAVLLCVALGAAIGSFAALVLDRARRGISVIRPPSHCTVCNTRLKALDNVPIVSWLILRGRCRYCKAFIPLHVVLFEIVGAVGGAAFAARFHY